MFELREAGPHPLGLYLVREGDTLASVCEALEVAPAALIAENSLQDFPPPGSILSVPAERGAGYTVRAGDTVASICRRFGMREEEFVRLNGCAYVYPTQCVRVRSSGRGG